MKWSLPHVIVCGLALWLMRTWWLALEAMGVSIIMWGKGGWVDRPKPGSFVEKKAVAYRRVRYDFKDIAGILYVLTKRAIEKK